MIRLFCLLFILANSVMAQAAVSPGDLGIARLELSQWQATHAGPTQMDGLDVIAALEKVENKIEMPAIFAEGAQTLVPLAPASKKDFRLVLVAVENPGLRASYPLEGKTMNIEGMNRYVLTSPENNNSEFRFLVFAHEDGSLRVTFTRNLGSSLEEGQFELAPMAQTL